MNTGQIISGAGHLGLIAWILFGGSFASQPMPVEVARVTAVTPEEYAAIASGAKAPEQADEVTPPEAPDVPQEVPDLSSQTDAAPETPTPAPTEQAAPDAAPEPPAAAPEAEVSDQAPVMQPPSEDMAALAPETSPTPQQRPADRVAPQQVAPPAPDTKVDDVVREEAVPDKSAETPREESDATAPEAAATEIVTEAEKAAPSQSMRPKSRPANLKPTPEETPPTQTAEATEPAPQKTPEEKPAPKPEEPAAPATDSAGINDALAAAIGGAADTAQPSVPAGPPLTSGEKDGMRIAVQNCWNVGSLSSDALKTTVTVGFEMTEDAKPVAGSIRMIDSTGGTSGAAKQAYEAARRAILRCGARGFDLPVEKYASWRNVELVFNPENMRIK